jgi:branched-chain amino acid transport system substrate-binding protein
VQSCDAVKAPIEAAGGTIVAREDTEVTATNLTTQILDLKNKGAEAVLGFQFPNVVVVMLNQAAENGLNVPILAGSSTGLAIATKNVTAAGLKNAVGFDDCAPASEARATDFATKYRAKFNAEPGYVAAEMYDGIMIIAEAVKKAGKADKKAVADALRQTDYKGACTDYKIDTGQGLHHSAVFESFDSTGKAKVEKSISIPAPAGGG